MCGVFGMRDSRAEKAKKRQCFRNKATVSAEHKSPSPFRGSTLAYEHHFCQALKILAYV
jgi:hypothetical protein